jgi:hypothetical protein
MRDSHNSKAPPPTTHPSTAMERLEDVKHTIERAIEMLIPVAERNNVNKVRHTLLAQAASLNQLGARIDLHQLPDGFVRSIINDAPLDTLMMLADLKVTLTFLKQDLAPAAFRTGLTAQHDDIVAADDVPERKSRPSSLHPNDVVADLKTVNEVEEMLKECML